MSDEGMAEAHKIPAASIDGIALNRIAAVSQAAADEITRIGGLLDLGAETTEDLARLCALLHTHGESAKAEELLRCNIVDEGDVLHEAYRRLFGDGLERNREQCIAAFESQFGTTLTARRALGFVRHEYEASPTTRYDYIDPAIASFLSRRV